jgi:hypothetical protein
VTGRRAGARANGLDQLAPPEEPSRGFCRAARSHKAGDGFGRADLRGVPSLSSRRFDLMFGAKQAVELWLEASGEKLIAARGEMQLVG